VDAVVTITEAFVLPPSVDIVPVGELAADVRARFAHQPGDYVITQTGGRARTHVVNASSAALLKRFRDGATITDAVVAFSRGGAIDPEQVLIEVWPVLQTFIGARLLVPANATEAATIVPVLSVGAEIGDWTAVYCVYLLEDTELWQVRDQAGRRYALKLARQTSHSDVIVARFEREARVLTTLGGRIGPALAGRGVHRGNPYLVVEWRFGSAPDVVADAERAIGVGPAELARLAQGVLDAYATLHDAGVLHGDVHPENLLVDRDGRVTIIDFAFARHIAEEQGGPRGGVPFYYEPELARAVQGGAPHPATTAEGEQFAVAAVVYRLLTGAHYRVFPLDTAAFWRAIAEDAPMAFEAHGVAAWPALEGVLARALAKAPADRYESMGACAGAFRAARDSVAGSSGPSGPSLLVRQERARTLVRAVLDDVTSQAYDCSVAPVVTSVMHGTAGIAYTLYRLALGRGDAALLALADLWAERARSIAETPAAPSASVLVPERCAPASPFHRVSGIHAVRALIAQAAGDPVALRDSVVAFIASTPGAQTDPDLTLGTSGVVLASAMLIEAMGEARADPARVALIEHGARGMRDVCDTLESLGDIDASPLLTATGAAHGWAGALFAVLRWCAATGGEAPAVVRRRLTELAAHAEPHGRGVRWPWGFDDAGRGTYAAGWCNGTAGMVPLWALAARVTGDASFDDVADRCAWHTWERLRVQAASSDLCCGDAGAAYALVARYQRTNDAAWLRRAEWLADRAVRRAPARDAAYRDSLYHGDMGIALLIAELEWPSMACMPFFGNEGWPAGS
jgi:eukaryotic-like serine/threonine-protein kinase